jgi:two-component sensor histidine kinase
MSGSIFLFFKRFLETGIVTGMHEADQRRMRLLNFFYLVATFTFIASTAETFLDEGKREGFLLLASALIFQLGLIPLRSGKRILAEFYFLTFGNISLFAFNNIYGTESGTFLYYFPYVIFIAFLVDFKKPAQAIFHLGLTLSFILISFPLSHQLLYRPFPPEKLAISFRFNFVVAIIMMGSVSVVIVRMMYSQYRHFNKRMEERRMAEESMKLAIREKETLLAEVHHRVKNNLAVISSLLNLQMNTVNNDYTRDVLRESRNRVASMALIHQKLYQHSNVEEIDFGSYASDLVREIKRSYPENTTGNISVHLDAEHIPVSLTKAVPAGLMLNELLSNCYKHAFPGKNSGTIFIRFKKSGEQCVLEVEDNGVGLSGDFKIEKQESLGMTIIQSLAAQIDSTVAIEGNKGNGTFVQAVFSS